jgi:hypothetical protein
MVKPIIAIPVHKRRPDRAESISIERCGSVLRRWPILFISPSSLDIGPYVEIIPNASSLKVADEWMSSVQNYNKLMISDAIFTKLRGYSHLLIHEPDAVVLLDELEYWCDKEFDYIGAPWFEGHGRAQGGAPIIGVGNSGFSLQRIEAALSVLSSSRRWYSKKQAAKDLFRGLTGNRSRLRRGVLGMGNCGRLKDAHGLYSGNCDNFWSNVVPSVDSSYRVASIEDALLFSWEVLPSRCYALCNGKLPFGMHAWMKYDIEFLQPILREIGCVVPNELIQAES